MFSQFIILKLLIMKEYYNFITINDYLHYYRYDYIKFKEQYCLYNVISYKYITNVTIIDQERSKIKTWIIKIYTFYDANTIIIIYI